MNAAFILLTLSAATGFAVGTSFSWFAIVISCTALAALSAAVLHIAGFDALSGIAIIATCLTVNQLTFVLGTVLASRATEETRKSRERHNEPAEARRWPNLHSLASYPTRRRPKQK